MSTNPEIDDIIRQLVLAHADNDIQAIAVVTINYKGEPEIKYVVNHPNAYGINFGLDAIKAHLVLNVVNNAGKRSEDRE